MSFPEKVERENNKDYNQVLLDVQRSLRRFPPGELRSDLIWKWFYHILQYQQFIPQIRHKTKIVAPESSTSKFNNNDSHCPSPD